MAVQLLNGKLRFVLASTPNNPFTLFVKLKLKRPLDAFEGLVNVVICTGGLALPVAALAFDGLRGLFWVDVHGPNLTNFLFFFILLR